MPVENKSAAPLARLGLPTYKLVPFYAWAELATEALLYFMVVFTPWAFGCTQTTALPQILFVQCQQAWTIWTMNFCGYALGILLLVKLFVRAAGYHAPRWDGQASAAARWATRLLAAATLGILTWSGTAVLNFQLDPDRFVFNEKCALWLPHSFDVQASWRFFLNHLALAAAFWAARDWLLGKTLREMRGEAGRVAFLPARLKRLLWVASVNGALLAVEGIAQRLSGTEKLLWYKQPRLNRTNESQFGPYAYRSNAAQYFNLLWPVALALWWTLRREAQFTARGGAKKNTHHWLLGCVLLMAVCPLLSFSRSGAIVGVAMLAMSALVLATALRQAHGATKFGFFLFFTVILVLGFAFGWNTLGERMQDLHTGATGRMNYSQMAWPMFEAHPWLGYGPGAFATAFLTYAPTTVHAAQLHNDWLETFITFGAAGSALVALAAGAMFTRRFCAGGIHASWRFTL
ncbi:MAG: hypothetical protein RLZZ350_1021, partial [Verrucomicrobiota bacterium]